MLRILKIIVVTIINLLRAPFSENYISEFRPFRQKLDDIKRDITVLIYMGMFILAIGLLGYISQVNKILHKKNRYIKELEGRVNKVEISRRYSIIK